MSKKHYEAIALSINASLAECPDVESCERMERLAAELATVFKADNHLFDRVKFLEACFVGVPA